MHHKTCDAALNPTLSVIVEVTGYQPTLHHTTPAAAPVMQFSAQTLIGASELGGWKETWKSKSYNTCRAEM